VDPIRTAVEKIVELTRTGAEQYFASYGTPSAALTLLRGPDRRSATMHSIHPLKYAETVTVLTLLVEGPTAAQRQAETLQRTINPAYAEQFHRFLRALFPS